MRKDYFIAGSGGQGVITLSIILAHAYGMYQGLEVSQTQSYGPEARGGACHAELVVSNQPIDYVKANQIKVMVLFNKASLEKYRDKADKDTMFFIDSAFIDETDIADLGMVRALPATTIANESFKPFVANIVMLGFIAAKVDDLDLDAVRQALRDIVPPGMLDLNMAAMEYGYREGKQ